VPHPIYGPPSHKLETVNFRLTLPLRRNAYVTSLEVRGETSSQRSSMWFVNEKWTEADQVAGLQPSDALHHLALIALQDSPTSQEHMFRALTGERWIQEELPL